MSESMVQRVAQAKWRARCEYFGEPVTDLPDDERREYYEHQARACMREMRRPTEDMARVGFAANRVRIRSQRPLGAVTKDAVPAYVAMIDNAIGEIEIPYSPAASDE